MPLCGQRSFRSPTYKLEEVARSICSSSALLDDDPNQPAMVAECAVRVDVDRGGIVVIVECSGDP